jgi:hypothetical protein
MMDTMKGNIDLPCMRILNTDEYNVSNHHDNGAYEDGKAPIFEPKTQVSVEDGVDASDQIGWNCSKLALNRGFRKL